MRYWDSSALIPLLVQEERSPKVLAAFDDDPYVITSEYAFVEIASALWRRRHDGELTLDEHRAVDRLLADLSQTWVEMVVSKNVINTAVSVLARHRLRSGDALQLATAITSANRSIPFVTLDEDLAEAAQSEGFPTLP
jgi:uncharacterized protein